MKKIVALVAVITLVAISLLGCSNSGKYKDGTYTGAARGALSDIKVSVEVKSGKISDIKIVENKETAGLLGAVKENVIPAIIKNQGTEGVDSVSGATNSSKGVITAVNEALKGAVK